MRGELQAGHNVAGIAALHFQSYTYFQVAGRLCTAPAEEDASNMRKHMQQIRETYMKTYAEEVQNNMRKTC